MIGVQNDIPQRELDLLKSSVEHILSAFGDVSITVQLFSRQQLKTASENHSLDLIFSDPAVFATLEERFGLQSIASVFPQESSSAESVSAAALIVSESSPIRTLKDAARKPLYLLDGYLPSLLKFDLLEQGYDVDSFFENTLPSVSTVEEAVSKVLADPQSAALIPACWLEKNRSARGAANVRIVEPRRESRFSCERTTRAYPGWVVSSTPIIKSPINQALQAVLLSLPVTPSGLSWSTAPDYRNLLHVLNTTRDSFYIQTSTPGWKTIVLSYFPIIATILSILLVLFVYGLLVSVIAGRRARELLRMKQQQELAQRKFEALERVSIIGQMSSVIAHELRQPITAIGNYASSIIRRKEKNSLNDDTLVWAMKRINAESERANEIIEHVRSYAKRKTSTREVIDLSGCIEKALAGMQARTPFSGTLQTKISKNVFVEADPLEMTLVVSNLYKNAVEACADKNNSKIIVSLSKNGRGISLIFSDNGVALDKEGIDLLNIPLRTSKETGLGLGLSIVRRIIESHGGDIYFSPNSPKGLKITIHLPEHHTEIENAEHEITIPDQNR